MYVQQVSVCIFSTVIGTMRLAVVTRNYFAVTFLIALFTLNACGALPNYFTLLSRGLKFILTLVTTEDNIRREFLKDFDLFTRRMRLQYIYYGKEGEPHPFHVKSDWNPPVQPSVALETFLEEVKLELAEIQFKKPKPERFPFDEAFFDAWRETRVDVSVLECFCWFVMCLHV